uniref:Uncharacterized protein n=1 Tax=Anguilla anguilla TaxID=7936 RepID=A0A0E9V1Q2_ANGAN
MIIVELLPFLNIITPFEGSKSNWKIGCSSVSLPAVSLPH